MKEYEDFLRRKTREYGDRFDPSALAAQFIPFYENGARIEVQFSYGEVKRGRVGVTTGWKPVFLLLLTTRAQGSSWTLGEKDTIIKVVSK